jgi:sodium/bile acid cotransporter 7
MTINMVLVLTKASGGEDAAAIFNAAAGNMIGVFLSPVLILGYLGVTGDIDLVEVFYKLALRVVLPVIVGQLLQKYSKTVVAFVKLHKSKFKMAQQYALVFIVYTVFCRTFDKGSDSSVGDIFLMILFQFLFLTGLMVLAWFSLKLVFPDEPKLRVMGLFGCTHKTVAMGVPLINAIYEDNDAVGLYTLPLLIWHPMQLVIGTFLAPKLAAFVKREQERLGIVEDENGNAVATESLLLEATEPNTDVEAATNNDEERIPAGDNVDDEVLEGGTQEKN